MKRELPIRSPALAIARVAHKTIFTVYFVIDWVLCDPSKHGHIFGPTIGKTFPIV
jgi:hypothetical protein